MDKPSRRSYQGLWQNVSKNQDFQEVIVSEESDKEQDLQNYINEVVFNERSAEDYIDIEHVQSEIDTTDRP